MIDRLLPDTLFRMYPMGAVFTLFSLHSMIIERDTIVVSPCLSPDSLSVFIPLAEWNQFWGAGYSSTRSRLEFTNPSKWTSLRFPINDVL